MTVKQQQLLLEYLGYSPGALDGIMGPKTKAAITEFQKDNGLTADGICGAQTEKMLKNNVAVGTLRKTNTPTVTPTGDKNSPTATSNSAAQYLRPDGYYHIPRGVDVQLTRNFSSSEIHCQGIGCCTESVISKRIMDTAQAIRDEIGEPLDIGRAGGAGYRCPIHNADPKVKGAINSLHTSGDAVDLHYRDPARLKSVALRHVSDGEVGIYTWGCHVGVWNRGYVSQFNGG